MIVSVEGYKLVDNSRLIISTAMSLRVPPCTVGLTASAFKFPGAMVHSDWPATLPQGTCRLAKAVNMNNSQKPHGLRTVHTALNSGRQWTSTSTSVDGMMFIFIYTVIKIDWVELRHDNTVSSIDSNWTFRRTLAIRLRIKRRNTS